MSAEPPATRALYASSAALVFRCATSTACDVLSIDLTKRSASLIPAVCASIRGVTERLTMASTTILFVVMAEDLPSAETELMGVFRQSCHVRVDSRSVEY